jgi:hypothetical protein
MVLVAHCGRCGATWALDFEPEACTCETYNPHVDDDIVEGEFDDYPEAVDYYRANGTNPQVPTHQDNV